MGAPQKPTSEQYAELEKAGQLAATGPAEVVRVADGKVMTRVKLDRQAVALLVLEWTSPE
jgi:xylan 1,4-beta-xylosidase